MMDEMGLKRLLRGGTLTLGVRVGGVLLSLAVTVSLSRLMGVSQFGRYSFLFSLVALLTMVAQIGLPEYLMRETAKSFGVGRGIPLKLWQWARRTVLLTSFAIFFFALVLFAFGRVPAGDPYAFAMCVLIVPLVAYSNLYAFVLRGLGQLMSGQMPDMVLRPLLALGAIWGAALLSVPLVSTTALAAQAVGAAGSVLLLLAMLRRRARDLPSAKEGVVSARRVLNSSLYLGLVSGLYLLQSNVDIIMLGILRPDHEVAIYKIAATLAGVAAFGLMATNYVIAPNLSALFHKGELNTLLRVSKHSARISFLFALSGALGLAALGPRILTSLFGANYAGAYIPLMILIVGPITRAAFGPIANVLSAAHREKDIFWIMMAAGVGNILLNLILIPQMGGVGAAIATAITIFASNVGLWWKGKTVLGIDTSAL